ncbi:NAD(P)/FAD-dependent oxidoreductase [Limnoglobus roseus]|uniref:NAD(P)/FAD-dependent oxidoreductase n=1 Tax=Limnoglobus roseus TaxID=2598579 RepID=A0A5C1A597_9BACT|nr:tryptophan 7-halogenase [Limnoglobus roseus]QEL13523.1 NAD(P)/FAD-dependent oxidoreductase [Limnoglobus roseus]
MTRFDCDLVVLGSGFGGTLLATIARKLGYSVVLLERDRHPRFAIGESSTPLSNYKLAQLADHIGLDWLRPFARYGTWTATHPEITRGLKRGFSFFRHERSRPFAPRNDGSNALLVAASPNDLDSDTHWLRSEFDAHVVAKAVESGVPYLDECEAGQIRHDARGWELHGTRPDGEVRVHAKLLVDATGTGRVLADALAIPSVDPADLRVRSRAIYSHFTGVARWQDLLENECGPAATAAHPYRCDDAALHQIIDGGWMWILRFDNGITSVGFSLDPNVHPLRPDETADEEWRRLLAAYPSLARQFARAEPVRPFVRTGRLQRRFAQAAGPDWAMLPHTAGFLDAWLSPGIAQTLFAVNRLGRVLADERTDRGRERRFLEYDQTVRRELAWVDEITGTCFDCFDRFPVLATVAMVYFVAAIYCEERERTGEAGADAAFLLADHPEFREIADRIFRTARRVPVRDAAAFMGDVRKQISPYNLAGLCDPARYNMYPFVAGGFAPPGG